jgi:hypothetical protein
MYRLIRLSSGHVEGLQQPSAGWLPPLGHTQACNLEMLDIAQGCPVRLEARLQAVMGWQLDGGVDPMQHRGDVHRDMRANRCNWIHG